MSWHQPHPATTAAPGEARRAAVAGSFYPAHPQRLRSEVEGYLREARPAALAGEVRAVIAPHAGYIYSGPIAGYSFRVLPVLAGRTVYLLGPAHFVHVEGVAAGPYRAMMTPLGNTPVAGAVIERLMAGGVVYADAEAHAPEHCLEVELPFLQVLGGDDFQVVPLLFGRVNPERTAQALYDLIAADDKALVVVSSDLSHYHPYDIARRLDTAFLDAVARGDAPAAARGEACGLIPILTLMLLAAHLGWQPHLLDYRNSGDTAGDRARVVGYGAIAYTAAS